MTTEHEAITAAGGDAARTLARHLADLHAGTQPVLFGVAGGVAAGKSTVAAAVVAELGALGLRAEILPTDAFLLPNSELEAQGLAMRKGFPESYDVDGLVDVLRRLRTGSPVTTPVYSHLTYDRVPGASRTLDGRATDVVVVEGVNALQGAVAAELDSSVYVDAEEQHAWAWFLERFLRLCEAGRDDPSSFYAALAEYDQDDQRAVAEAAWAGINVVNLREQILPTRDRADWVLRKRGDHSLVSLERG